MDQRQAPRFESDQVVTVTMLGEIPVPRRAVVRNASGLGLGLEMEEPVAPGVALKIEFEDSLLLGEVVYSRPLENSVLVGVRLSQVLRGLAELARARLWCAEVSAR